MIRPTCSQKRREIKESRVVLLQGAVDFDFSLSSSFSIPFLCFFFFCFFCSFFLVGCNQYTNKAFSRCYLSFSLLFFHCRRRKTNTKVWNCPAWNFTAKRRRLSVIRRCSNRPPPPGCVCPLCRGCCEFIKSER